MAQQKGMKRAQKVAQRSRKLAALKKTANIRRSERQSDLAEKEAAKTKVGA